MSLAAMQPDDRVGQTTPMISTAKNAAAHETASQSDGPVGSEADPMAIVWAVMEKVGSGERDPQLLAEGSRHEVDLQLSGHVDGRWLNKRVGATVTIGHDQTKSTSATPQLAHLVAYILGKLNNQTRMRVLNDLPDEFAANDCVLPDAEESCVLLSAKLLKKLRSKKQIRARRAIRCQYRIGDKSGAAGTT